MQGQILGDFRIVKQIGQGTLGNVFLAEHRFIKKSYALKILPPELAENSDFIKKFEEEIVKLGNLSHPHIVKIHNVSSVDGYYFLVTDCVTDALGETTNLAQYMSARKERLKEPDLLRIVQQLADALDYAHNKGQVEHRALKLNNILIGKGKNGIDIFLADLGLAKIISPGKIAARTFKTVASSLDHISEQGQEEKYSPCPIDSDKLSKLSQSFLQTYAFLAPEQKKSEQITQQVDVYAFGVMVYFLISGFFPEGIFEMPSVLAPEYRHNWDHVVSQCLKRDPQKRPTQLLPLVEQKKGSMEMPLPLRMAKEEYKEAPTPVEHLKNSLLPKVEPSEKELVAIYAKQEESFVASHTREPLVQQYQPDRKPLLSSFVTPKVNQETAYESNTLREPVVKQFQQESKNHSLVMPAREPFSQALGKQETSYDESRSSLNAAIREPMIKQYQPERKDVSTIEPLLSEMVLIPSGSFIRGSNEGNRDEMPCHKITIDSFALDIHPVTNEQFVLFLEFVGGEKDTHYNDLIRLKDSRINRSAGRLSIEPGYAKHPVVGVTWYGADAYAKWIGRRLPTEAEWEIAALGRMELALYPTGDTIEKHQANFFSSDTTPVMSFHPNGYGLFDMPGNVYEWCSDWYSYNYYEHSAQEPINPKGPQQGVYRVLRGGCWKSLKDDLRCAHRHRNNPGAVNSTYGFRCALTIYSNKT